MTTSSVIFNNYNFEQHEGVQIGTGLRGNFLKLFYERAYSDRSEGNFVIGQLNVRCSFVFLYFLIIDKFKAENASWCFINVFWL